MIALALVALRILADPSSCHVDGLLPDRRCTPGAVATTSLAVICGMSTRPRRHVSEEMRARVFRAYGLPMPRSEGAYVVDHLVPLELGGSNDLANLWPEAALGSHEKDRIEETLHERVCRGALNVADAQRAIASDWRTAAP
jgi:hypothetical protein